jgi:hypothetical protein
LYTSGGIDVNGLTTSPVTPATAKPAVELTPADLAKPTPAMNPLIVFVFIYNKAKN